MTLALVLVAALHAGPKVREAALAPLLHREAKEHHLPFGLLAAVAERESTFRYWKVGDHGAALGIGQLHADCIPGRVLSRRERMDVGTGVHWMAARLAIARRRCGGPVAHWAANYSGRRCGADPYRLAAR